METKRTYDIFVGDKFYHTNHCVEKGLSLPDQMIVTKVKDGFVEAKYENHWIGTKERIFSLENLWSDSNLNPKAENPQWVFFKKT